MWFRRKSSKQHRHSVSAPSALATHSDSPVSTLQRVRLPVDLLQPGMRVVSLDRPWTQVPVLLEAMLKPTSAEHGVLEGETGGFVHVKRGG